MICKRCGKEIDDSSKQCQWCGEYQSKVGDAVEMVRQSQMLIQQGRVDDALANLDRALEVDSRYVYAWLMQASILQSQQRWEESIQNLEKALQINPGSAELWFFAGNAFDALSPTPPTTKGSKAWKCVEQALMCFAKSLELNSNFIAVWFSQAQSEEKLGRHQDAMRSYEKFLSGNPGADLKDQVEHARARLATKQILVIPPATDGPEEEAKTWIERLAGGGPEDFLAFFDMTLQLNPEDPRGWVSKGYALENLGRDEEALAHYDKAIQLDARSDDAWTRKGTLLAKLTQFDEAIKCFEAAIASNPRADLPLYRRGVIEQSLGKLKEAIDSFRKFVNLNPPNVRAHELDDAKRRLVALDKQAGR